MKRTFSLLVATLFAAIAISCGRTKEREPLAAAPVQIAGIDSLWQRQFSEARSIIELYDSIEHAIAGQAQELHLLNQCHYVWQCGEYMFACRGKNSDIYELPKRCTPLSLDDKTVAEFEKAHNSKRSKFVDHYFTLQAMQKGCSFDDSRDGITGTVFYPIRALNENDYDKLRAIFSCKNDKVHNEYLERLKFPLSNSGCTDGLKSLEPLIEQNVADCDLKSEVLEMYRIFSRIRPGEPAPLSVLKDPLGHEHTFAEFAGKVLVIDVWATWCHSCIENMHKFKELREAYADRHDVCFITVSVDRSEEKGQWLSTIEKQGIQQLVNLFPDCEEQSQFETDFQILGVPRYIIIGKDGEIISAHAPSPGPEMKKMIDKALK